MPDPTPPAEVTREDEPPRRRAARVPPIVAGMLLDAVDFATMGPLGLYGGFVLGALAAYWAAREVGLEGRSRWVAALAGAVYAATPATELLPLGTLIGVAVQIWRR